jgi:hypothetical protein
MRWIRRGFRFILGFVIAVILVYIAWAKIKNYPHIVLLRAIYAVDPLTFFVLVVMALFGLALLKALFDIYFLKKDIGQRGKMLYEGSSEEE